MLRSERLCNKIVSGYFWVVVLEVTGDVFFLFIFMGIFKFSENVHDLFLFKKETKTLHNSAKGIHCPKQFHSEYLCKVWPYSLNQNKISLI